MKRAAKITLAVSAVAVAGVAALAIWGFPRTEAPLIEQAAPTSVAPTPTATPPIAELPAWAQESSPWIIYPEGFRCQGTEGCPNSFRSAFGEPGEVLPAGVEYYDPAKHDYDGSGENRFMVLPAPADGVDAGRQAGAQGTAVVSGADTSRVQFYIVAPGDSLGAIGERFHVDPATLTRDGEPTLPGETQIRSGDQLVFP